MPAVHTRRAVVAATGSGFRAVGRGGCGSFHRGLSVDLPNEGELKAARRRAQIRLCRVTAPRRPASAPPRGHRVSEAHHPLEAVALRDASRVEELLGGRGEDAGGAVGVAEGVADRQPSALGTRVLLVLVLDQLGAGRGVVVGRMQGCDCVLAAALLEAQVLEMVNKNRYLKDGTKSDLAVDLGSQFPV